MNSLAIRLSKIEPKAVSHGLSFSLTLSNIGNATLLLPLPRMTDLRLTDIESNRTCEWYTHMMVNSSGMTFTLDAAKQQAFDLHARFQDSEIEHARHDVSNFCRWCTDMTIGRYMAQYHFTVDKDYFHPDSHARLRHLEHEAEKQNATAWIGSIESTPIRVERRAT